MPQARPAHPLLPAAIRRVVNAVVVHCSATPSGQYLSGAAPVVIDRWHAERGFKRAATARKLFNSDLGSIGYHFVVDIDGRIWTGRHLDEIGAHVAGQNANSIGICMVGGAERVGRYTQAQWDALAPLVRDLVQFCQGPIVLGHRDLSPDTNGDGVVQEREWLKTCPGFSVTEWKANGMAPLPAHLFPARKDA